MLIQVDDGLGRLELATTRTLEVSVELVGPSQTRRGLRRSSPRGAVCEDSIASTCVAPYAVSAGRVAA